MVKWGFSHEGEVRLLFKTCFDDPLFISRPYQIFVDVSKPEGERLCVEQMTASPSTQVQCFPLKGYTRNTIKCDPTERRTCSNKKATVECD